MACADLLDRTGSLSLPPPPAPAPRRASCVRTLSVQVCSLISPPSLPTLPASCLAVHLLTLCPVFPSCLYFQLPPPVPQRSQPALWAFAPSNPSSFTCVLPQCPGPGRRGPPGLTALSPVEVETRFAPGSAWLQLLPTCGSCPAWALTPRPSAVGRSPAGGCWRPAPGARGGPVPTAVAQA